MQCSEIWTQSGENVNNLINKVVAQLKVKPRLCHLCSESRELVLISMQGAGSPLAKEASFRTLFNMEPQNVKVEVNSCLPV